MSIRKSDRIISVEHVSKYFGEKAVLNDVNLQVRKGGFVSILGPSGCGKTTLLRLIAGFQTASEGVITMSGKEITQTPPHKRPVNTVFQKYALFPNMNVYDNIAFGLKIKKEPKLLFLKNREIREQRFYKRESLGRGWGGVWGGGTFLQKGSPSPPHMLFLATRFVLKLGHTLAARKEQHQRSGG